MLGVRDLDHLAARLHGRRARLADGPRLRALCGLGTPAALAGTLFPGAASASSAQIQERLSVEFIAEVMEIAACLDKAWGGFIRWQASRFQLENLKTALRGVVSGAGPGAIRSSLLALPPGLEGYGPELAEAKTPAELLEMLPEGGFRDSLAGAYAAYGGGDLLFFYEAALDRDHLMKLADLAAALGGEDRGLALELAGQEIAAFDLMLAARGRFFYGLEKEALLGLFAPGPGLERRKFRKMLEGGGAAGLRACAGTAVDPGPPEADPSELAALVWRRYAHLAGRALRRSHLGPGTAAAYSALRRVETANLITVAEGLRLNLGPEELARRLIPRAEAPYA